MAHVEGTTVRVHYRGTLEDGSEFDTSRGRDPLEFTIGSGQVIPGFESAVADMAVGDNTTITLDAENAYGGYHEEAVQVVPVTAFTDDPYEGAVVQLLGPNGERLAATITAIEGDDVTLDFNHPLAGKELTFEIELIEVVAEEA
ncbi:MAG: peptidylprolyl isomerase [Anaerosomatales bacterium]|nr:peptidylprolyl isomerase [Anaerosomatales bacterium]MDT8433672.1 peptidylprolyl isomerase [Anaerosomatales bacterium]